MASFLVSSVDSSEDWVRRDWRRVWRDAVGVLPSSGGFVTVASIVTGALLPDAAAVVGYVD